MGFRFFQSMGLGKRLRVNIGKSLVPSLTSRAKGVSLNLGKSGVRAIATIPGTGIGFSVSSNQLSRAIKKTGKRMERGVKDLAKASARAGTTAKVVDRAGHVSEARSRRTSSRPFGISPASQSIDEALAGGIPPTARFRQALEALAGRDFERALAGLNLLGSHPDALFITAIIHYHAARWSDARSALDVALVAEGKGELFQSVGAGMAVGMPLTPEIEAEVMPTPAGLKLMLVEVFQAMGDTGNAVALLRELAKEHPENSVVKLSLAEILYATGEHKEVLGVLEATDNAGPIETACLLYRGRSMRALGLMEAALLTLGPTLYRVKGRPPGLLREIRYEKALCQEELGKKAEAKKELERLYAEDPRFRDVKTRLGLA